MESGKYLIGIEMSLIRTEALEASFLLNLSLNPQTGRLAATRIHDTANLRLKQLMFILGVIFMELRTPSQSSQKTIMLVMFQQLRFFIMK
ncbi:hypothetical protein SPV1_06289 [Mariprofundus ferrooxydans PV-1]|uniref:Uncharacterized protein n=1 Tax=Mariprofundus ferrooxydans PV-1 TaxID=314345 RepID=Q0EWR3_9PROT|nr:hypothetical protein SPV1_06289 [Mariprofundus ferrooxydans PV-1]